MVGVPGQLRRNALARPALGAGLVGIGAEPGERFRDRARARLADEARSPVLDDLQRAARVACRDHGLLGEERLERDEAHVLVDRRVEDGEASRVLVGESVVVQPARERDATVQPMVAGELLEPRAIRALACDHDAQDRRPRPRPRAGGRPASPGRAAPRRGRSRRTRRSGTRAAGAAAGAPRPRARPTSRASTRRSPRSRTAAAPPTASCDRAGALHAGRRGRTAPRRTRRAPCGRGRTPAGTGARARRPCSGGA